MEVNEKPGGNEAIEQDAVIRGRRGLSEAQAEAEED